MASPELIGSLYAELKRLAKLKLAREDRAKTLLSTTELLHEAYLRLAREPRSSWDNAGHYFSAAAEAMSRILVEAARRRLTLKRGGKVKQCLLRDDEPLGFNHPPEEVLEVHEALKDFARSFPKQAELVRLRYFVGLKHQEAANKLGISRATADRYWQFARAWLRSRLDEQNESKSSRKPR
ncbi:MAG: extracytoplasmic sigma factor ECF [Nitrospiraceae bacterium]|nr:MAG: extracytoplasmic sigma factor ECF [Nitrospiraceae bacterium]